MVHELTSHYSVLNQFVREIRDQNIQKDSMRFRRNLERIGEIMAYEISKSFPHHEEEVITPLGAAPTMLANEQPVLCAIMRAALPMHTGFLNYFDAAENSFVSAYRRHHKGGEFEIEVDYASGPSLDDKVLIIIDPMLATGASIEKSVQSASKKGTPKKVHIACAIASQDGVKHVRAKLPESTEIWAAAIDSELTAQAYIVPGLGDAGDLAFGRKE